MEWRLAGAEGPPAVWSAEFHAGRARAPHLEQDGHRARLILAAAYAVEAGSVVQRDSGRATFSDLGCGDGGLLSLVQDSFARAWGYDFCPANAAGWAERGVTASALDVFGDDWEQADVGEVVAMTEVLEHLRGPHAALGWVRNRARFLVCSSPWSEREGNHAAEHAWAWDQAGYAAMIEAAGWVIERHEAVGWFQVVLAR